MAITMRKGAYADFDPSKMKAGEWAVSTDTDSNKQQVWMCFSPGVVKRMGTVEDFDMEIQILIRQYLDGMAESVKKAQESAKLATSKAQESANSASNAKTSETNAKTSETNASNSATKAKTSETNSKTSETKAKASETSASTSASNAKTSETNSKTSETNAKKSETNASTSATNAKSSETNAKASATNASTSANNAKASETKAKEYEESTHSTITVINEAAEATRLNKEAAAQSEANAKASENQALSYKNSASASEQASKASETNAKTYADNASASATSASTSASKASQSKTSASTSASQAKTSETNAKTSETNSAKSESEAKKYAEQVKEISESFSGALRPLGTINFANLPSTADASSGDMYNIADQFTTTADFKEGSGNVIPAGSNVYLTIDRYWDVLAGTPVTGVKGAKEAYYRRGNVNITPANIGAVAEDGDISDTTVTFADATTRANLVSGEKVSVGFGKIKKWFADLKSFAFKDLVNNLTTTTTGSALDASQGKILNDKYDELNNSLAKKLPYYDHSKGQGTVYAATDEYVSNNNGTYISLSASKYYVFLKQFYNGALTFQFTSNNGADWYDLLRFDETNLTAAFGGAIYEQGTALSNKYITQKGGQIINFSKSSYVKTSYCDGYAINHIGTLAICMEVNGNTTWSDCHLGTVSIKPYHTVKTTVVLQDSGLSIPLRINTDGNVYLEIKGITPGTSGWIYGGITYYYN